MPLINTFSQFSRHQYGEPVGKIPIDLGIACPNRAFGGCIYCRPASFTPAYLRADDDIGAQVTKGKKRFLQGRFKKYYAYFQQETCTAAPLDSLLAICRFLFRDSDCIGLILSTRPDAVPDALLTPLADLIASANRECLFELGLQSIHARSLRLLNRNHTMADFTSAVTRITAAGPFSVGAHLIFGIPGESQADMLDSLVTVCGLGIQALKLHHLQVVRDTPLAAMHARDQVVLFSLDGYMRFLLRALPLIPAKVVIHRLWATCHPELLIAPRWNILATQLSRTLREQMEKAHIHQGQAWPDA